MIDPEEITVTHEQVDGNALKSTAVWMDENGTANELVSTVYWADEDLPKSWEKTRQDVTEMLKDRIINKVTDVKKTKASNVRTLFSLGKHTVRLGKVNYNEAVEVPGVTFGRTALDINKSSDGKVSVNLVKREGGRSIFGGALGKTALFVSVSKKN